MFLPHYILLAKWNMNDAFLNIFTLVLRLAPQDGHSLEARGGFAVAGDVELVPHPPLLQMNLDQSFCCRKWEQTRWDWVKFLRPFLRLFSTYLKFTFIAFLFVFFVL